MDGDIAELVQGKLTRWCCGGGSWHRRPSSLLRLPSLTLGQCFLHFLDRR